MGAGAAGYSVGGAGRSADGEDKLLRLPSRTQQSHARTHPCTLRTGTRTGAKNHPDLARQPTPPHPSLVRRPQHSTSHPRWSPPQFRAHNRASPSCRANCQQASALTFSACAGRTPRSVRSRVGVGLYSERCNKVQGAMNMQIAMQQSQVKPANEQIHQ